MPWLAVRSRLQLAKVYWATGDQSTARHLLREIDDILLRRPALGALVDAVAELRHLVSSNPQADVTGASPLTPAELRLLPYLQTHLTIREIAERTFVSRNTVSSQVSAIYRKLGSLVTHRRSRAGDDDRPARRVASKPIPRNRGLSLMGAHQESSVLWKASRRLSSRAGGGSDGRASAVSVLALSPRMSLPIAPESLAETAPAHQPGCSAPRPVNSLEVRDDVAGEEPHDWVVRGTPPRRYRCQIE